MKKRTLLNFYLFIALVNFVSALLLVFINNGSTGLKIASFLFFVNFVLNMLLATKRSKGKL
ncbi:hypothetical protein D4M64_05675 [Enterococcus gallinarum]|nr:hypothetical protein EGX16_15555 [Enterococcus gallinarum]ROZ09358.1 hypothetical protein EGX22_15570 [Enterococcus gallinarum]TXT67973.1 hypothetical protein D4N12_14435 [Enterococcus gallinarum]TXW62195.1 hypothetical protein D4M64_05675 [Enterococcus gallinarum]